MAIGESLRNWSDVFGTGWNSGTASRAELQLYAQVDHLFDLGSLTFLICQWVSGRFIMFPRSMALSTALLVSTDMCGVRDEGIVWQLGE